MSRPIDYIWPKVMPHTWKWARRTKPIQIILLHSTRGGQYYQTEREYSATMNWFSSSGNRVIDRSNSPSGAVTNRIIGANGRMCIVIPDEFYARWSAGHMDPIALSYEICQSNVDQPYASADIDRAVYEVAADCVRYNIPPKKLLWVHGDNREAPGIAKHQLSDNGYILGKSDPGYMFPDDFEQRVAAAIKGAQYVTDTYTKREIDAKVGAVLGALADNGEDQLALWNTARALGWAIGDHIRNHPELTHEAEIEKMQALTGSLDTRLQAMILKLQAAGIAIN